MNDMSTRGYWLTSVRHKCIWACRNKIKQVEMAWLCAAFFVSLHVVKLSLMKPQQPLRPTTCTWERQHLVPRRMMAKQELARLYFPDRRQTAANARHQLVSWFRRCRPLWQELQRLGYTDGCHYLTPTMVDVIFHYIGEPDMPPGRVAP